MLKLLLAVFLCVSSSAHAEWTPLSKNDNQKLFVDWSTLKRVGGKSRIWTMYDILAPNKFGARSNKMLEEADCDAGRTRVLSLSVYAGNQGAGDVLATHNSPGEWSYPAPETFQEIIFYAICGRMP